ncbi:LacI family DNA-binding transcriptional regulator [Frankia sp. CNm7]|uniref:LacI family DNA-binding transcriptional regulator n=1 Tax=Frankia nepalensis TaxID=1836974 RepID=A0A937RGW0_9ACTN|nr:LacI family DNA-binding transcriptional regulator [Frankia nepalensis]MBL7497354.1 LacI family DNA-binding transcriptional regulator [Frankia nepalensis]MBL7510928.1 LacI family DNA-binding transcriptional regulator [Frankia nepalensis]MBL7517270.1 LacI family DNA-binding transcriptional regulator [Frankia nepalensis]MBL7631953.1 LacI family DNA-binding transcriptional regulator [Frankia nepalensis]
MADLSAPSAPRVVTIYDVARSAGVAASTVSRAFSRPGRVNAATAERIRRIADELGYRANPVARALSTARTNMIAVVILDIANPFYAEIVRGAQAAAAAAGYTVVLADAQESDRLERSALERAVTAVDGIVLASSRMSDSAIRMISKQKPVVVLNRAVVDVPCVVTDNARGARLALEHLGALGHDHVTYVAGPEASWADGMRWRSLREAAAELSLRVRRIGPFAPDVPGGIRAAEQLAAAPVSAVVAYNDQLAIGLVQGLATRGIRVPGEVSVIGFDNIAAAGLVTPGLTTVAAPLYALGVTATRHVLSMIEGGRGHTGPPAVLPVRLMARSSTAEPYRVTSPRRRERAVAAAPLA